MEKIEVIHAALAKRAPSTRENLEKAVDAVYEKYRGKELKRFDLTPMGNGAFQPRETREHRRFRFEVMKASLANPLPLVKAAIGTASNIYGYDLQAPSHHLVPFLSPIRDSMARVHRALSSTVAHWKQIDSTTYGRGGMPASPWINEGQRAPEISLQATDKNVPYVSLGVDGSVTFEEVSASEGFEDALATEAFFRLETLMLKEEDAIIGGNSTLLLGQANTPSHSTTGSGSFTGTFYGAVVGMTYEGYRNFQLLTPSTAGLTQQLSLTTADGKPMQINSGIGQPSAISTSVAPSSSVSATFAVVPKTGEIAWAWYIGTSSATSALYFQGVTTVPSYTFTAASTTSGQLLSGLAAADYSANNGSLGGGANQVKAFDGLLTQCFNASDSYVKQLNGAKLTASGNGGVVEIDDMLEDRWNTQKVSVDIIYVNAQQLRDITKAVLAGGTGGSPASLLRYNESADGENYDLVASGTISMYFNPYMPGGGRKIPIMVHPTLPSGTILGWSMNLPPYFKTNSTPAIAEMLTRRDYYAQEFAITTREYQFGVYCEEALAVYATFGLMVITGIAPGINQPS